MIDLKILGRSKPLFEHDLFKFQDRLCEIVESSRFLVIGGGGTIGQAVTKELFIRKAKSLHVVDLSENYLVELVRDLRSSHGYAVKDFNTHALDCGCDTFKDFMSNGRYDYVLNLSAMKHVRSENCPFSMVRMLKVNVINALNTYQYAKEFGAKKYFCVSTDKAANPANFMGATKRAMELVLMRRNAELAITGARFANVAFSNGSLLEGFRYRIEKRQPLSMPDDVERFFVSQRESGIICLFAAILGGPNQIFFPFNDDEIKLIKFTEIAENFLTLIGKKPVFCYSENEARELINTLDLDKRWPINLFHSDTAGEKPFEEFYTDREEVEYGEFRDLATINFYSDKSDTEIKDFLKNIREVDLCDPNARNNLLKLLENFVPSFAHINSNKFLNSRM